MTLQEKELFIVDLSDGNYYQVTGKGDYTLKEDESYVNSEAKAIKKLNDHDWYKCEKCHVFYYDQTVDPKEHFCDGEEDWSPENKEKIKNLRNKSEEMGKLLFDINLDIELLKKQVNDE